MNRTLGTYPFLISLIAIIALVTVCVFNMYLVVKHKKSYFTICVHIVSLLGASSLIFSMLGAAMFVRPVSEIYNRAAHTAFVLAVLSILCALLFWLVRGRRRGFNNLPYSIAEALKNIEPLVFVIDQDGSITNINNSKQYHNLLEDTSSLDELLRFLKMHCTSSEMLFEIPEGVYERLVCELYLEQTKSYIQFQLTPIFVGTGFVGYTAVLEDISSIKNSEKNLEDKNKILQQANVKLSQYIKAAGALEEEKERLQILTHIQETLISDIEKALSTVRCTKTHSFSDGTYPDAMQALAAQLRQIYQTVRRAVGQIAEKEVNL